MTTTNFDYIHFDDFDLQRYHIPFSVKQDEGLDLPYNFLSEHLRRDPSFRRRDWFLDDLDRCARHTYIRKCRPDLYDYFNSYVGDPMDRKVKRIWRKDRVEFLKCLERSYKEYLGVSDTPQPCSGTGFK